MTELEPLKFVPYLKSVIWGGDRICQFKGIDQPEPNIGESWEISAVPGHESVVSEGVFKGRTLNELISQYGSDLLGEKVVKRYGNTFPLLIKFIDARDNLSVQVHPDDELARKRHDSLGKTEMWYIIDADRDAKIYAGLNIAMTPEQYVSRVASGTFAETLACHDSHPGDVFFLPAGRVHAIGAGNLLAEIQESSDVTYRIYDYDRRDAQGNTRELHTELAKDAIDYTVRDDYKSPRPDDTSTDCELVRCEHFTTRRVLVDGTCDLDLTPDSFSVIMCVDGSIVMEYEQGSLNLDRGNTALIPAVIKQMKLRGKATLLVSHL